MRRLDKTTTMMSVTALMALMSVSAMADGIVVGFHETSVKTVSKRTVETVAGSMVMAPGSDLVKAGAGTMVVPMSAIDTKGDWQVTVQAGKLRLSGAAAELPNSIPEALQQKAAFWLDASTLTEGAEVTEWNDCRGGTDRYSAKVQYRVTSTPPVVVMTNGIKGVYFGGVSGKWMRFYKGSEKAVINTAYNYYVVYTALNTWSALLGDCESTRGCGMNVSVYSPWCFSRSGYTMFRHGRGDFQGYDLSARFMINGQRVSPWQDYAPLGTFLFESDQRFTPQHFNSMMFSYGEVMGKNATINDAGGDYVHEVVVFDTPLSEVERLEVERYLMRKWDLPQTWVKYRDGYMRGVKAKAGLGTINAGAGSKVEIDVDKDGESVPVRFAGQGEFVKKGEGSLVIGGGFYTLPFNGSFTLSEGDILLRQGACPSLTVSAGETWEATQYPTAMYEDERMLDSGVKITKSTGNGTEVTKTGEHEIKVGKINSGVTRINIKEGGFALSARETPATAVDTGLEEVEVPIENNSFEQYFGAIEDFARRLNRTGSANVPWMGWYNMYPSANNHQYVTVATNGWTTWMEFPVPDGTNAMIVGYGGYVNTDVTLPRVGDYEFSFKATGRHTRLSNLEPYMDIVFNDRVIGTVQVVRGIYSSYKVVFTVDSTEVGEKKRLGFRQRGRSSDECFVVDDLHLKALAVPLRQDIVKVPGGDFENADHASQKMPHPQYYSSLNVQEGWTFTVDEGAPNAGHLTNDFIGVMNPTMRSYHTTGESTRMRIDASCDKSGGYAVLLLCGNYGNAISPKFTLSRGRWMLRTKAAKRMLNLIPPGQKELQFDGNFIVTAKLTRGDGSSFDLGKITSYFSKLENYVWPNTIEVLEDGETVSLTLKGGSTGCAGILDDLEFVPAKAGLENINFIYGSTLEHSGSPFDWTWSKYPSTNNYESTKNSIRFPLATESWAFGMTSFDGIYNLHLHNASQGKQNLMAIPEPGLYRFTMHLRRRCDNSNSRVNPFFAYTYENGQTNVIMRVNIPKGQNFVEYSRLFRFQTAGVHPIALVTEGCPGYINPTTGKDNSDYSVHLDGFSIEKVDERNFVKPIMSEDMRISVEQGALLALDYPGTNVIRSLKYAGRLMEDGVISAKTHPEFVHGIGALEVRNTGFVIYSR